MAKSKASKLPPAPIPEVISIRNPHIIERVTEEMKHMPHARAKAEATEALILDGIEMRKLKRLGLLEIKSAA